MAGRLGEGLWGFSGARYYVLGLVGFGGGPSYRV